MGDDWRLAAGVITSPGLTFVLAHHGMDVWWLLPAVLVVEVALSVSAVARRSARQTWRSRTRQAPSRSVDEA